MKSAIAVLVACATAGAVSASKLVVGHQMLAMPRYGANTSVEQMREEIRQWKDLGLDGTLLFDIHGNDFRRNARKYYKAGVEEGYHFAISTSYFEGFDVDNHAEFIAELCRPPFAAAQLMQDGKPYLSAYHASGEFGTLLNRLKSKYGIDVFAVPQVFARSFNGDAKKTAWDFGLISSLSPAAYATLMDHPAWKAVKGFAAFDVAASIDQQADEIDWLWDAARSRGKSARATIVPYYKGFAHKGNWMVYEGWGYARLQAAWRRAIKDGVPAVELITLNDFAESSYFNSWGPDDPVLVTDHWNTGDIPALLDHSGFRNFSKRYVKWFKTGVEPRIEQDELYYAYRLHPRDAADYYTLSKEEKEKLKKYIPNGTNPDWIYRRSGLPERYKKMGPNWDTGLDWTKFSDGIHVAVRLTAPADVYINGVKVGSNLPAGEHLLVKPGERYDGESGLGYPLHTFGPSDYGRPTFEIRRNGRTVLKHEGELEITPYPVPGCWNVFARQAPPPSSSGGSVAPDSGSEPGDGSNKAPPPAKDPTPPRSPEPPVTPNPAPPAFPSVPVPPTTGGARSSAALVSLSTRGQTAAGDDVMIGGFAVSGPGPRSILIRAIGPSLSEFDVGNALSAVRLHIYRDGRLLGTAGAWSGAPNAGEIVAVARRVGAFELTPGTYDAAALMNLAPGAYTVHVEAADGRSSGISLLEVYDASSGTGASTAALNNISTRGKVGRGNAVMIAGFVIEGTSPQRVLIRGIGPGLRGMGVHDAISNPRLELFRKGTRIGSNDDWGGDQAIASAATKVGAFALKSDSKDAAMIVELAPGVYTAHVSAVDGGVGTGLVEVYALP